MNYSLIKYLEKGSSSKPEKFFGVISPGMHDFFMATKFYLSLKEESSNGTSFNKSINIPAYSGNNPTALGIRNIMNAINHPAIVAALVHGSIATDEIINYSDFDGILIINPNKIKSRKSMLELLRIVAISTGHMRQRDALQHHGWSVLTYHDLDNYPDALLPAVLLEHSKCIYPLEGVKLNYRIQPNNQDYRKPFFNLTASLYRKCTTQRPETFYALKNFLSELLLLPAMYFQAKTGNPVFKRESFAAARPDFNTDEWQIIEEASVIRLKWDQSEVRAKKEAWADKLSMIPGMKNLLQIKIPERYRKLCTEEFYLNVLKLLQATEQKIGTTQSKG